MRILHLTTFLQGGAGRVIAALAVAQRQQGHTVTVVADGRTVFEGRVQKNVTTLLTWAARDNDRTMLYGAALPIVLAR